MDILEALNDDIEEQPINNDGIELNQYTFKQRLKELGCDDETIEDCLFEPVEKWEFLLNYFERKQ